MRTGKGKLTLTNGLVYEGDFLDGMQSGKGKWTKVVKEENPFEQCVPSKISCESECIVCMDAPRSVLLLPCKHLALCSHCWLQNMKECPCCRGLIDSAVTDIFTI
jgi:hypothetical protein